jgi:hydroxyacylglutathione hydrolase
MFFRQVYEEGLAQASYLIGCQASGSAIVIDPKRDIDTYLEIAQEEGLRIVGVAETHIHADYLSGARELAQATGARLYLSGEGDEQWQYAGLEGFDHRLLKDGDSIELGNVTLTVLHTPGHTPEHLSFLVTDRATTDQPGFLLSGDFVFVGDLGRPDLLEEAAGMAGSALPAARRMFQSLKEKFLTLPDYVQVWPGHGAGSACGKALGAVPSSTVGYERRFAWWADYLRGGDEEGFVKALLEGQPEAPAYFARMKRLNREGMSILGELPKPPRLSPEQFRAQLQAGAVLVDTRDRLAFAGGHLRGSINIPASRGFSTWAGWLLPHDRPLVLLAAPEQLEELTRKLVRIGLDSIQGYITGLEGYAGGELETVPQVSAEQARELLERGEAVLLDVRAADEYAQSHIPGALNLHAGRVMQHLERLPRDRPLITYCLGGDRSSTATSALMAAGFHNLLNLSGGLKAWKQQRYPLERGPTPS